MGQQLVDESMKKAAVAWVAVDDNPAQLVWCMPAEGALWAVSGPGEQQLPELTSAARVTVTMRGSHGGRIVSWPASVSRLDPGSGRWDEVAPQLAGKRLNAPGDTGALLARWASECVVYQLVPVGTPVEAGATLPDASLAGPPRPTPARRATRAPFRLHRVRRR